MADIDLRDPTAATTGVPGAFQQANTTYTFEVDFASFGGVRAIGDSVELINLPQGFVAFGACIEVTEIATVTYTMGLALGGEDLIADAVADPEALGRTYNVDGVTVVASDAVATGRVLTLDTLLVPPLDGKMIVTVTGATLHARG